MLSCCVSLASIVGAVIENFSNTSLLFMFSVTTLLPVMFMENTLLLKKYCSLMWWDGNGDDTTLKLGGKSSGFLDPLGNLEHRLLVEVLWMLKNISWLWICAQDIHSYHNITTFSHGWFHTLPCKSAIVAFHCASVSLRANGQGFLVSRGTETF